ncbi:MAG: ribosomal RNA small subunit methyltransferase A [Candidatus Diapherotrites archaeon]|nr:ribosomal RNA small subunit methyltransferase A [Candidatus Diapherotrites archaeon]
MSELNQLMISYRFKSKKQLSQNFLIDEKILEEIIALADLKSKDKVLEIGCGTGFLTKKLLEKSSVIGVEKDFQLIELLKKEFTDKKFTLIEGDFLKVKLPEFNKVVSLPPYHISSLILMKLMHYDFDYALIVFQKDFTEKLLAEPGFAEYTAITCLVNYFFEPEILIDYIPSNAFQPSPKTPSALIKLTKKHCFGKAKNDLKFIKFIKELFRFKNKNLANALHKAFPFISKELNLSKKKLDKIISSNELMQEKISLLEIDELVELFNELA